MRAPSLKNIPWQGFIIAGFALVIALFCGAWLYMLLGQFTNANYEQATEATTSLSQSVKVMVDGYEGDDVEDMLCDAVDGSDYRIRLLDEDFRIIADTSDPSRDSALEDVEIRTLSKSMETGISVDSYVSDSDGVQRIFVARTCTYRDKPAIIQVSTDARAFNDTLISHQAIGLGILLTCLLIASFIAYIAYRFAGNAVNMMEIVHAKFVANASHELKTPVAGIKLLSETIIRAVDRDRPDRIRECAERIDAESDHLERIISSLIDVARDQSSVNPPKQNRSTQYHLVDAREAAQLSFDKHRLMAEEKKLSYTLEIDVPDDVPLIVLVPAPSSTAIADNLIENAIHYTSSGFVRVKLTSDGDNVVFSVADSGMGMTPREQEMVFERHYRSHRSQAINPAGSGIGLALVREATRISGGTVTLESESGKGSTFTVTLPIVKE